jgi:hypothetical protein
MNLHALSDQQLLDSTHAKLKRSHILDAQLLELLGEIDDRKLYPGTGNSELLF